MPVADLSPGRLRLRFRAGDRVTLPVTYAEDGVPQSLTGHVLTADIRRRISDPTARVTFTMDRTNDGTGLVVLGLNPESSVGLKGRYVWHYTDETAKRTLLADVVEILPDAP